MPHPRNQRERLLTRKRKGQLRTEGIASHFDSSTQNWFDRTCRSLRKTTKTCFCPMCGNPRKFFNEITMQERKEREKEKGS